MNTGQVQEWVLSAADWLGRQAEELTALVRNHPDAVCLILVLTFCYVCFRVSLGWMIGLACRLPYQQRRSFSAYLRASLLVLMQVPWGCLRLRGAAWRSLLRAGCFAGMLGVIACLIWSFEEPYHPQVTYLRLTAPGITLPLRLVQISDLHCDEIKRAEPKLPEILRKLKPAAILFTGDGFNTESGAEIFFQTMREVRKIAPVYAVRGNWEVWTFPQVEIFGLTGMINLEGKAVALPAGEGRVWVCGSEVGRLGPGIDALRELPRGEFRIFLQHFPCHWRDVDELADLYLAGDTHGGQINIPLLGPFWTTRRIDGVIYPDGLQQPGRHIKLYVNRGYGMMGGMMPRVRFRCPPEITVIDLQPASGLPEFTPTAPAAR